MLETVPFAELLAALRARGIPIGLAQQQEALRLILLLGRTCDTQVLGRSLGALLGRTVEESLLVQDVFFSVFSEAFQFPEYGPNVPRGVVYGQLQREVERAQQQTPAFRPHRTRTLWLGLLAFTIVVVSLVLTWRSSLLPTGPSMLQDALPMTVSTDKSALDEPSSPPVEPMLGPPPYKTDWSSCFWYGVPLMVLSVAWSYARRRWQEILRARRSYWDEVRNSLPGAVYPKVVFPSQFSQIERTVMEDMATILGRGDSVSCSTELDPSNTVLATIACAGIPSIRFAKRKQARMVVVLCDVANEMRPWTTIIGSLLDGLRSRGVSLVVRYFVGDAEQVFSLVDRVGKPESLASLKDHYPDAALLVVSTGNCAVDRVRPGRLAPWMKDTFKYPLRAWLNPILNRSRWTPLLRSKRFPMRVLPMTPKGLIAVAYELSMNSDRRPRITDEMTEPVRTATQDEIQLMRELCSIMTDAPIELAEFLRREICSHIPVDALAQIYETTDDVSRSTISWGMQEIARNIRALRKRDNGKEPQDRLEERSRRKLLDVLRMNEPASGSRAHLDWQLMCAQQQIHLHGPGDQKAAIQILSQLLHGPLYEMAAAAVSDLGGPADRTKPDKIGVALPVLEALRGQFPQLKKRSAAGYVARVEIGSGVPQGISVATPPWTWPRWKDLVVGCLAMSIAQISLSQTSRFKRSIPHVIAYNLSYKEHEQEEIVLSISRKSVDFPLEGDLCRDFDCRQRTHWTGNTIPIRERKLVFDYHVRAKLADGNWAYSPPLRVNKYKLATSESVQKNTALSVKLFDIKTKKLVTISDCVIIDSMKKRRSCLRDYQDLSPGLLSIQIRDKKFVKLNKELEVKAGELKSIDIYVTPQQLSAQTQPSSYANFGFLRINSKPWTKIFIDGTDTNLNTPQTAYQLSPGMHQVMLYNPEFGIRDTFSIHVIKGETQTVIKDFRK